MLVHDLMKSYIERLINLGITDKLDAAKIIRIKQLNTVVLSVLAISILLVIILTCTGLYKHSILAWGAIIVGVVVLWLVSRHKLEAALYFFSLICLLGSTLHIFYVGNDFGIQYTFFLYPFNIALLTHNKRFVGFITILSAFFFIIIYVYFMNNEPIVETSCCCFSLESNPKLSRKD